MKSPKRRPTGAIFAAGLLIFLLVIGNAYVVQGQENGPRPDPSTPSAAHFQDQVEPASTPEPTTTPAPTSTPTISSEVSAQVSESISSIDRQTVLNLVVSFVVVILLAYFGLELLSSICGGR